nr:MAG TPA: immunity protein [Caudoviricetes sp.]
MDEKNVPYIAFESTTARQERSIKRLTIALIVTVVLMFGSNALWLYAWCQYDYSSTETSVELNADGDSNANYIGNDGDITNGGTR